MKPAVELPLVTFRVHLAGEPPIDVEATTPELAGKKALAARPGAAIAKIKRVKGG